MAVVQDQLGKMATRVSGSLDQMISLIAEMSVSDLPDKLGA
jgi:hypothetical protein